MALADWTLYQSQPGLTAEITTTTPILDAGSLRLVNIGEASSVNLQNFTSLLYTPGLLEGRMRQILRIDSAGKTRAGFAFMQSAADISTTDDKDYYQVVAHADATAATRTIRIDRIDGGSVNTTNLFETSSPAWTVGSVFTIEVDWQASVTEIGGTRITVRTGTATDFSDLSEIADLTDPSPDAHTTTLGEGPYILKFDTTGETYEVRYDNTSVFQL